ncbi:MAG: hypothetical protein B6I37_06050 [Desulfobacteraceae bacterium 4572_35.2]|nr:MAG: hypothetical protein B6I37_06050 [Desulfobacteraceae bacterium 4572_35.2]
MSYTVKYLKNWIKRNINMMCEYRKAISVYSKEDHHRIFSIMISNFKAHLKYGISPLLYSYYQLDNVPESHWGEYFVDQKKFNQLLAGNSTVEARRDVGNKLQFYRHCITKKLPTIPVLCVVLNECGFEIDDVKIVSNLEKWHKIMPTLPSELFIKPIVGSKGIGSFAVYRENDNFTYAGCRGSGEDLFDYLKVRFKSGQGFIVQPRMKTHSSLIGIVSPQGLSTIRVVTLRHNGKSEIIMACLKIINGKNEHDNFLKGMSNNLIAPINIETGELTSAWGSLTNDWPNMVQYALHPDTGVQIENFVLPLWREVAELALRAQESLPLLQTIGWDIALTDEGVFIVEANTAYDAASFQLFEKRGLKSELQKLFSS